jgi:hypothetical protein
VRFTRALAANSSGDALACQEPSHYTTRWHPLGVGLLVLCAALLAWAVIDRL